MSKKDSAPFQKKAHATIAGPAAPVEAPAPPAEDKPAPWEGKKRLDASPKSLRVPFSEDEIAERRVELEKRLSQTPHLRDQMNAAKDAAKAAKDRLSAHTADAEGYSAITKQGWQYQDVECIEVVEKRPGGHILAVTYRTDTREEVSKREATKDELQEHIGGL